MPFQLESKYKPTGDQPQAIRQKELKMGEHAKFYWEWRVRVRLYNTKYYKKINKLLLS